MKRSGSNVRNVVLVTAAAAFITISSGAAVAAIASPISFSDVIGAKGFPISTYPTISSDGMMVAFTIQDNKRVGIPWSDGVYNSTDKGVPVYLQGTDIYVADLRTGKSKNLTQGAGSSWGAAWARSGRYLAFFSDRDGIAQLWLWTRRDGSLRRLSTQIMHPSSGEIPIWMSADKELMVPVLPKGMTLAQSERQALDVPGIYRSGSSDPIVRTYTYDPHNPQDQRDRAGLQGYYQSDNGVLRDFDAVDVSTGAMSKLFSTNGFLVGLSSDATLAAVTENVGAASDAFDQSLFDIRVISLKTGASKVIASNTPMAYGSTVSWSPRDHALAYVTSSVSTMTGLTSNRYGQIGECYVFDNDSGNMRWVTKGKHPNLGYSHSPPIWDTRGNFIYFLAENQVWKSDLASGKMTSATTATPVAISSLVANSDGTIDVRSGMYAYISDASARMEGFTRLAPGSKTFGQRKLWAQHLQYTVTNGRVLVFVAEDEKHPRELWMANSAFTRRVQLTHLNPQLDQSNFGARRLIGWHTKGGDVMGDLILPMGYQAGRRYPTIIYQYPYEMKSQQSHYFDDGYFYPQLLTSRGYAVFEPDFPLSKLSDIMEGPSLSLFGAMLDKLIGIGVSDPHRFGICGASAGGYSTLSLIAQTNRFGAAVEDSGMASHFTLFTDLYRNGDAFYVQESIRNFRGTPWTARQAYIDQSPFFFLDKVHTPLLILHGDFDGALGRKNADDIFVSLRSLGREVSYALYTNGGHTMETFSYAQKLDAWQRIIDWFDSHLKASGSRVH